MSTLISWIAYEEDFIKNGKEINPKGPHYNFYMHHLASLSSIKKHILLYNEETTALYDRVKRLQSKLRQETRRVPRKIELQTQLIPSNAFDSAELFQKLDQYLINSKEEDIIAMVNTGTKDMHTVWYLLQFRYPKRIRLISVVDPIYSKDTTKGDIRFDLTLKEDVLPSTFTLRQASKQDLNFKDFQKEARIRAISIASSPDTTALILGDHGTGKESLAKTIHENSARKTKPYLIRNCAGYTDELLRPELFGHIKGSFTGANSNSKGIFEQANGGTVFLDEIGDISPFMQINLLRLLQNKEIVPVGSTKSVKIDVRVIAATNKDLLKECEEGNFRWDLYYRLAVAEVKTKPVASFRLSEKREMIKYFLKSSQEKFQSIGHNEVQLNDEVFKILDDYHFPGNIREVENLIESLYTFNIQEIKPKHLPERILNSKLSSSEHLNTVVQNHCQLVFDKYGKSQTKAMKILGIKHPDTFKKYKEGKFINTK